jgi:hypothetical protein
MVRLPRGKEHWQAGDKGGESTFVGVSQCHGARFTQAGQRAVQRVYTMAIRLLEDLCAHDYVIGPIHTQKAHPAR